MSNKDSLLDRDRGVLTKKDREYLLGDTTYHGQQLRNRRGDIRKRIKNALIDFTLLKQLDQRDRKQISDSLVRDSATYQGLIDSVRFYYLLSLDANIVFEDILEMAIRAAEKEYNDKKLTKLELSKEYASDKTDKLYSKAKNEEASEEELVVLLQDLISRSEYSAEQLCIHKQTENDNLDDEST